MFFLPERDESPLSRQSFTGPHGVGSIVDSSIVSSASGPLLALTAVRAVYSSLVCFSV